MTLQAAATATGVVHAFVPGQRKTLCGRRQVTLRKDNSNSAVSIARRFAPTSPNACGSCTRAAQ